VIIAKLPGPLPEAPLPTPSAASISRHAKPTICLKKTRFRPPHCEQSGHRGENLEAMVDVLIISALVPDYWPLLAGLTMAAVLAMA